MYIYIYIYTHIYVCTYISIYNRRYFHSHPLYTCIPYICISAYIYIYICVCVCVYTYMYRCFACRRVNHWYIGRGGLKLRNIVVWVLFILDTTKCANLSCRLTPRYVYSSCVKSNACIHKVCRAEEDVSIKVFRYRHSIAHVYI